jgi:hypothetical protein
LLLAATAAADWAPTVTARLGRDEAHVGDLVDLHVTVIHRKDVGVALPARIDLGKLTLLDTKTSSVDLRDGRVRTEFVFDVAAYQTGDLEIPSVEIVATGPDGRTRTVGVGPIPLRIASLLPDVPDPRPRPDAVPIPAPQRDWRLVAWAGAVVAAGVAVLLVRAWRKRRAARAAQSPALPPEPPHVIALRRLAELAASDLLERGEVKTFYERLSLALRDYLGARHGFDALEMTTAELALALARAGAPGLSAQVDGLLSGCDLVKFAKHRPVAAVARGALDEAVHLVERTRPARIPPAAPKEATRET